MCSFLSYKSCSVVNEDGNEQFNEGKKYQLCKCIEVTRYLMQLLSFYVYRYYLIDLYKNLFYFIE